MRIQAAPLPPPRPKGAPSPERSKVVVEWLEQQKDKVGVGQTLIWETDDGHQYRVEGNKIHPAERSFSVAKQFITAGIQEVQAAIAAGPNLALVGATQVIKPMVLANAPAEVVANVEQWYQPGLQAASVAISAASFIQRWNAQEQRKQAGTDSTLFQKIGLVANGLHIASSSLGLAGALGAAVSPSMAGFGAATAGIALASNVVIFGVNWLEYFHQRSDNIEPLGKIRKPK